jgi:ABC-type branched-subunit amino acid transport system ATPase component/branched-subunit amino acid ABC-type transport system permease component
MDKFLALLISGGVSGAIYSLIAAGLVLTYSTSGVFNFAHGAVAFATALVYYEVHTGLHWPIVPAAIVAIVVFAPGLGLLLDAVVFRRLVGASETARLVATVGLLVAIPSLVLYVIEVLIDNVHVHIPRASSVFSPAGLGPVPKVSWRPFGSVRIDSDQVVIFGLAVIAAIALWYVVRHTRLGLAMRATVERPNLASIRGVNIRRTSASAWLLGFLLAGIAGVAGSPLFSLDPATYTGVLFVAATAAVLGRLRSIPIAFAGGLLLGIGQSLFAGYVSTDDIPGLADSIPFILLFVVLVGLGTERTRVAGSVADVAPPPDYLRGLPLWRRALPWAVATGLLIYFVMGPASAFDVGLVQQGLAYGLIFLSFVLVTGAGGMVSLAQSAFVLVSSLVMGWAVNEHWPFALALLAGVAAATVLGVLVALPALRLGGLFLALATLALALIGDTVLFVWKPLSNGDGGWSLLRPVLGPFDGNNERQFTIALLVVLGIVALLVRNYMTSPSGRALIAVRSTEAAATAVGISPVRAKLRVFALSAAVAGLGGGLLATVQFNATHDAFSAPSGLTWLAIVVLVGIRRPAGAVIAGIGFVAFPQILSHITTSTRISDILFGLGAVQLAMSPDGILTQTGSTLAALRHRLARRRSKPAPEAETSTTVEPVTQTSPVAANNIVAAEHEIGLAEGTLSAPTRPDGGQELALEGVCAGYGELRVLHEVTMRIPAGRITALLGANGAGKSTLCAVIAGLVAPTSGTLRMEGRDITKLAAYRRSRERLALAPEQRGIFPGLTVDENLRLALPRDTDPEAVYERFRTLAERRKIAAGNLSGGEQQLLTMAPLVLAPPKVLVADEPSLGLAPLVVREIMTLLSELRDSGTAVLVVEEKATHVLEVADHITFLELGHIAWSGDASEVNRQRVADSFLQLA